MGKFTSPAHNKKNMKETSDYLPCASFSQDRKKQ